MNSWLQDNKKLIKMQILENQRKERFSKVVCREAQSPVPVPGSE